MTINLPPCDLKRRKIQVKLCLQMADLIREHATSNEERDRMNRLVFQVLSAFDGFSNKFTDMLLVTSMNSLPVNGYLHDVFLLVMDGKISNHRDHDECN